MEIADKKIAGEKKSKDFKPECYTEKINLETEKLHEEDIVRLHSDDKTEILK